ncbi:MAG: hypothetical protein AAGC47_02535 [Bacteroidota bacterium]
MNGKILEVVNFNDTSYTNLHYDFDRNQFKRLRINIKEARKEEGSFSIGFESDKGREIPILMEKRTLNRDEVFSYTSSLGSERVFYFYDEPLGNVATEDQMRAFVIGERDARLGVSGDAWLYSGMAVGLLTGYLAEGSVLALAVPPLLALTAKIPVVKIKQKNIQDLSFRFNEDYAAGYERYSRGIFARKALIGSAIGTALGLISYAIVDNNR